MPAMIVWPVSSSVRTVKVGSSSASDWRALPIFSWSAFVFGSTATWITGSGNSRDSSTIGLSGSQSVSPVLVFFMPMPAMISPEKMRSRSSRELACICSRRPRRSLLPERTLSTVSPLASVPEYTRK